MAHIFVVDDDEQLLKMAGLMLKRGGHTTTLISNPLDALERLQQEPADLAILDVMMPNMSGYELCRALRVREATESLPIIILTARSQDTEEANALANGANLYLGKPVTSQELVQNVDNVLKQANEQTTAVQKGFIIAVYGFQGGAGRTTLAVNLALSLQLVSKGAVCLADFTSSGSQAAMQLRLQSQTGWLNLLTADTLTHENINPTLLKHDSSLHLLPAPALPQPATHLTSQVVQETLATLRQKMLFTIVDLPPMLTPAVESTLATADMGLHILTPDVSAVQTAVRADRVLSNLGLTPKERSHILNQRQPDMVLPKTTIERGLNARIPVEIGYDYLQPRALSQGTPVALNIAPSPLKSSLRIMAEALRQKVLSK